MGVQVISSKLQHTWEKAGQPLDIFQKYPEFAKYLHDTHILSQMKITRDQVAEVNGQPALLVEREWVPFSDLQKRFEVVHSPQYDQKFVVERATRNVFTYLDNGRGFQNHHPFQSTSTPISTLDEENYQKTWQKACEFIRSDEAELTPEERAARNKDRPFILQLVTSYIHHGNTNYHQFLRNPKHSYIRMIVGKDNPALNTHKGEVYEVGYGWKTAPKIPFIATTGRFRSPDIWEYKTPDERIVTNIPVTQEEAHRFYEFSLKYHLDGIHLGIEPGFHLIRQNCTVYFREACKAAGLNIPTEVTFSEIIARIAPDWIRKLGQQLSLWKQAIGSCISRFTPNFVSTAWAKIVQVVQEFFARIVLFSSVPARTILGDGLGEGGAEFRQVHEAPQRVAPSIWHNSFTFPKFNQPGVVQEWQRQQPSTVVYKNHPVKLTIVPQ